MLSQQEGGEDQKDLAAPRRSKRKPRKGVHSNRLHFTYNLD
jgi:hypothetical protein